ncbi:hypothetical protein N7495_009311 [Penicillium taxi]|uniref:uncharacterized protein n=1 Tax=Penicillium taxi TaxID=168475 RepID=UPI0025450EB4|nr:uncharacterized protein N7495_009311 [Penicillium taxi]KAJ5884801.1 hypothetical protein N7495_009311 [Penicillium taxi]
MDLVPQPNHSKPDPVNVPLLVDMPYEISQPGNLEKRLLEAEKKLPTFSSAKEIAFYIQSRFFFGLLANYLDEEIQVNSFAKEIKGHQFVCLDMVANSIYGDYERYHLRCCFRRSEQVLARTRLQVLKLEGLPNGNCSPVPEVALSTLVLCDALLALIIDDQERQWYPRNTGRELIYNNPLQKPYQHKKWPWVASLENVSNKSNIKDGVQGSLLLIIDRLEKNGWCPSTIQATARSVGYLTLYYMSQINRTRVPKLDHGSCTDLICMAAKNCVEGPQTPPQCSNPAKCCSLKEDEIIFNPQHTSHKNESCSKVAPPIQDVIDILKDGKIPLVKFEKNEHDGHAKLKIVPARVDSRYVAVSHVWSDGLGNSHDNSIWQCQLDSIIESISNLPNHRGETMSHLAFNRRETLSPWSIPGIYSRNEPYDLFWLDILCIPAKHALCGLVDIPEDLRSTTVSQISAVFAGAMQVMILDREMQRLRRDTCQMPEILALFQGCNWASRAWTYKEGQGSLCYVKLQNGFFNPRDIVLDSRDWSQFIRRDGRTLQKIVSASVIDPYSETTFSGMIERWLCHDLQRLIHQSWFFPLHWDDLPEASVGSSIQRTINQLYDKPDLHPPAFFASSKPFISVWNELLRRSCSNDKDRMYILAMSLQMSPDDVFKIDSDERLKAILWSFSDVPLSLLFDPCKKNLSTGSFIQNGPDKWIQRSAKDFDSGPIYPLKPEFRGKLSPSKDQITFELPVGQQNPAVMVIPHIQAQTQWLRVVHNKEVWIIRIHSAPSHKTSGQAILIIDTHTLTWENDKPAPGNPKLDGKWFAGCCLEVNQAPNEEPNHRRWFSSRQLPKKIHATYLSSISVSQPGKANDERIRELCSQLPVISVSTMDINSDRDLDWSKIILLCVS